MKYLKAFFRDKTAQKEWADFIIEILNREALERVYAGKDTAAIKEAKQIIERSFKELKALFTEKPKAQVEDRGV